MGVSASPGFGGIGSEVMNVMFAGLGDLGQDASDELEDIESVSVGMVSERVVLRSFTFIEESSCAGSPVDARQRDGASQEVTRERFDAFGGRPGLGARRFSPTTVRRDSAPWPRECKISF